MLFFRAHENYEITIGRRFSLFVHQWVPTNMMSLGCLRSPTWSSREANNWLLSWVFRHRRKAITGTIRFPWTDKLISICGSLSALLPSISFRINAIESHRGSLRNSSWRCNMRACLFDDLLIATSYCYQVKSSTDQSCQSSQTIWKNRNNCSDVSALENQKKV